MKRTRRHALGQHFLVNKSILQKIVQVIAPEITDTVIEIGAGRGALTTALAERAGRVIAIEKDRTLIPLLAERSGPRLTILEADVLRLDFCRLWKEVVGGVPAGRAKLVGNLPYSISSPILFKMLDAGGLFSKCVFLIQKEVAERICSRPGSKSYSPLSILIQNEFEAKIEFSVSPGSFSPPPRVDSALISFVRRESSLHPIEETSSFRNFLWTAFAHRRKLLAKNLEMSGVIRSRIEESYRFLDLAQNVRAEELSIGQFAALFQILYGQQIPKR